MRYRRRKNRLFIICIVCILIISVLMGFVFRKLEKPFETAFCVYASEVGNEAVNYAVRECFAGDLYNKLIITKSNSQDEIVSLSANTFEMNRIKAEINEKIKDYLISHKSKRISLYLGSAQDNMLFSAFGPKIKVKVHPYPVVKTDFRDEFASCGINQVRHCIYVDVYVSITVAGFSFKHSYDVKNSLLVADTVIVGRVPQVFGGYLHGINNKLE